MKPDQEKLYTPREVGNMFRVDPKTVTRWILSGKIPQSGIVRTLGNHIRIKESEVQRLWDNSNHD